MEKQETTLKTQTELIENWIRLAELDVILADKIYDASLPDAVGFAVRLGVTV